jgi:hypothetical protein
MFSKGLSMTFDEIREIALSFPNVEEYQLFGTPAYRIGKRFLACPAKVAADTLMLKMPNKLEREFLLSNHPEIYYLTPHYEGFNAILIRLAKMETGEFRELFEGAWRTYAPKKLLKEYYAKG